MYYTLEEFQKLEEYLDEMSVKDICEAFDYTIRNIDDIKAIRDHLSKIIENYVE